MRLYRSHRVPRLPVCPVAESQQHTVIKLRRERDSLFCQGGFQPREFFGFERSEGLLVEDEALTMSAAALHDVLARRPVAISITWRPNRSRNLHITARANGNLKVVLGIQITRQQNRQY